MRGLSTSVVSKRCSWGKLRIADQSQQPVLGIKEILRTGSCEPNPITGYHFDWHTAFIIYSKIRIINLRIINPTAD